MAMKLDLYANVVLTIIAICLIVLTLRAVPLIPQARAAGSIKCTGELKANAWGGTMASIGGYDIDIRCSD